MPYPLSIMAILVDMTTAGTTLVGRAVLRRLRLRLLRQTWCCTRGESSAQKHIGFWQYRLMYALYRMYTAGHKYGIDGLKALALDKYKIQLTRHW